MEQEKFDQIIELKRDGKFDEAESAYKQALIYGDHDPKIFTALGKIFFLLDDYQHAINSYLVFFTIMRNEGHHISPFINEIFHLFMAVIRNTQMVALMEERGIDGGEIIWRLRNANSVCAYKNALLGKPLYVLEKGIDYGKAGESLIAFGTFEVDDKMYTTARNIFENRPNYEMKFTVNSIDTSTNQYRGIPIGVLVDKLIME